MRRLLVIGFVLLFGSNAWSSDAAFEKLLSEMEAGTIFKQSTTSSKCPAYFKLVENEQRFLPAHAQAGDRSIKFWGLNENGDFVGGFTFEGNSLYYRPGLASKETHTLKRKVEIIAGAAYTWAGQKVEDGIITSEYSAKILSAVMIASSYFKVIYNSNENEITYFFRGNGVDDVSCTFTKQ